MDLYVQKLNSPYFDSHFDTYLTYMAQDGQKLQYAEFWSKILASKVESFGSFLQFHMYGTYRYENFQICQAVHKDQENITCWGRTRNRDELARFESFVFSQKIETFVFFHVLIIYARGPKF